MEWIGRAGGRFFAAASSFSVAPDRHVSYREAVLELLLLGAFIGLAGIYAGRHIEFAVASAVMLTVCFGPLLLTWRVPELWPDFFERRLLQTYGVMTVVLTGAAWTPVAQHLVVARRAAKRPSPAVGRDLRT